MLTKTLICFVAALLIRAGSPPAVAVEVSVDVFYEALEPHGNWIEVEDYGYCWNPRDVSDDWRPYADGHWVFTDAGWTWVSNEPFGWAVYHYGRWVQLESTGWVWVPDQEWGPAWVSWRRSDRYVGWAPLPPEAQFTRTRVIREWADSYYDIGPGYYSFVEVRNFGAPRLREVLIEPQQNVTIINQTTNITNIRVEKNVIYNGGPDYDVIVKESAQPVRRLKLDRRTELAGQRREARRGEQYAARVEGDSLRVVAPRIQSDFKTAPRKLTRRIEHAKVNRGWQMAGDETGQERLRAKFRSQAKAPADLPPKPKFERASAKTAEAENLTPPNERTGAEPATSAETATRPASEKSSTGADEPARKAAKRNTRRAAGESDSLGETPSLDAEKEKNAGRRKNAEPRTAKGKPSKPEAESEVEATGAAEDSTSIPAATPPQSGSPSDVPPGEQVPTGEERSVTSPSPGSRVRRADGERASPSTQPANARGGRPKPEQRTDVPQPGRDPVDRSGDPSRIPSSDPGERPPIRAEGARRERSETRRENIPAEQRGAQSPRRGDGAASGRPLPEAKPAGPPSARPKASTERNQRRQRLDEQEEADRRRRERQ